MKFHKAYLINTSIDYTPDLNWLSHSERTTAADIKNASRRQGYGWVRIVARQAASDLTGRSCQHEMFVTDDKGKHHFEHLPDTYVSWTHVKGYSMVVLGFSDVGIDLERYDRALGKFELVAERRYPAQEVTQMNSLTGKKKIDYFLDRWVEKEAVLKAWGVGLSYGIINVQVAGNKARDATGVQPNLKIKRLDLPAPLLGVVAVATGEVELEHWQVDGLAERDIIDADLRLEPLKPIHAEGVWKAVVSNQKEFCEWLPWAVENYALEDAVINTTLGEKGRQLETLNSYCLFADEHHVGRVTAQAYSEDKSTCEIGYWLDATFQGRGLMSRSVKLLMTTIKQLHGTTKFIIRVDERNAKSVGVPKRLGFEFIKVDHETLCMGYPSLVYRKEL